MSCLEVEDSGSQDKPDPFKHPNRLIFAHININSIRNKLETLQELIGNNIDVLLISETKLGTSFFSSQFFLDQCSSPYRPDRCNTEET